jgi:hypothetical protein
LTGIALLSAFAVGISYLPASAQTQPSQPAAIVEDVDGAVPHVGVFEYLEVGRLIRLSAGETLVLGYLASCLRETIHGGEITIGANQSSVTGGLVIREDVECDGGFTDLSVAEASQSGVIAFRQGPKSSSRGTQAEPIRIFSSEPVFTFSQEATELVIHRLDQDETDLHVRVLQAWLDLADHNISLGAGGLYEARVGAAIMFFEIASHADVGGPLVGRVIRF